MWLSNRFPAFDSSQSCWLVSRGKVYDVTPFLKKHPAGVGAILRHAGTDSTEDFDFHSKGARAQWKEYKIGKVGLVCLLCFGSFLLCEWRAIGVIGDKRGLELWEGE